MLGRLAPANQSVAVARDGTGSSQRWAILAVGGLVALLAASLLAQTLLLERWMPPVVAADVDASTNIRPETAVTFEVSGLGAELKSARLLRAEIGLDGKPVAQESLVAAQARPIGEGRWQLLAADGSSPLRADGSYRLSIATELTRASFPIPSREDSVREIRFSTLAGPVTELAGQTLRPRWGEPAVVEWASPMESAIAVAQPEAPISVTIDPANARRTLVTLGERAVPGQTYEVLFTRARSVEGVDLSRPLSLKVAVPARPSVEPVAGGTATMQHGKTLELRSSQPLADVKVDAGDLPLRAVADGNLIRLSLPEHIQGVSQLVRIESATSTHGAPLVAPIEFTLRTPAAFGAPSVAPADGAATVAPSSRPTVTFAGAVHDRAVAERSVSLEPAVEGRWQWTAPDRMEFRPADRLPFVTDFTLTVHGGPEAARGQAGGYIPEDVVSNFKTSHYKRIDVSISRQLLTMYEEDRAVGTIRVATGVPGADTPLGEWTVSYKMPQARFRGVNPSGQTYDIPDVNWVLAFYGDYTIHGAHWRSVFGAPGSNGCVSMSDPDAKRLYDWADVGSPITIRM